jgi:hypothetical protein
MVERLANRVCTSCGRAAAADGHKLCSRCQDDARVRMRQRTERFKALGLCCDCGKEPARPLRLTCRTCHLDNRFAVVNLQKQRRMGGLCVMCGEKCPPTGGATCLECRAVKRRRQAKLRDRVFAAYGGPTCRCCGESHVEFLEIDHVNDDGRNHRRRIKAARSLYTWLRANKFPPGFQVLCRNCNMAKHRLGVCPHERDRNECQAGHP